MLTKPDRDVSINLHNRVTMRYVLGDFTETPAAKQNYENTDGQMQAGVALGGKAGSVKIESVSGTG